MKKIALVLAMALVFWMFLPCFAQADLDEIIKDNRTLLSVLEIQNAGMDKLIIFLFQYTPENSAGFLKLAGHKALLDKEKNLISKANKLLDEIERDKKDIDAKMTEFQQNILKIWKIHSEVLDYLNEKYNFLLREFEKGQKIPV